MESFIEKIELKLKVNKVNKEKLIAKAQHRKLLKQKTDEFKAIKLALADKSRNRLLIQIKTQETPQALRSESPLKKQKASRNLLDMLSE